MWSWSSRAFPSVFQTSIRSTWIVSKCIGQIWRPERAVCYSGGACRLDHPATDLRRASRLEAISATAKAQVFKALATLLVLGASSVVLSSVAGAAAQLSLGASRT